MPAKPSLHCAAAMRAEDFLPGIAHFWFVRRSKFKRSSRRAERSRPKGFGEMRFAKAAGSGFDLKLDSAFAPERKVLCDIAFLSGKAFCICSSNARQLSFCVKRFLTKSWA